MFEFFFSSFRVGEERAAAELAKKERSRERPEWARWTLQEPVRKVERERDREREIAIKRNS